MSGASARPRPAGRRCVEPGLQWQQSDRPSLGLFHNATSLQISVTFQTTGDGVILGYQDQPLGSTPGNYVPLLYIGTNGYLYFDFSNGSSKPIETNSAQ